MRFITTHALRKVARPAPVWRVCAPVEAWSMVPGLWRDVPGLEAHAGSVVYEKTVTCAGTLRFAFGGAADACSAWLDGKLLCEHEGPGAFAAVAHDVAWGEHLLRVEVRCARPGQGGFTGEVTIEQMGSAFISGMKIVTRGDGAADVRVKVRSLAKKMQVADVEACIAGVELAWKKRLLPPGAEVTLKGTVQTDARLWSADDPALYPAEAVLWLEGEPADDLRERVGFRGEAGEIAFAAFPLPAPEDMLHRLQLARAQGCEGLKVCGASDGLLDLCDQLGMPVWDTCPACEGSHACMVKQGE